MKLALATALAALAAAAAAVKDQRTFAVLHFNNKQLTKGRVDPIVSPGQVATHVHNVMGASGFGLSSKGQDLQKSRCSTAKVKGDNSNYWFPSLYFKDPKTGKLEDVQLFYANAYYFFEPTNDDIKAFPLGLNVVSGDVAARSPPAGGAVTNLDPSKGPVNPVKWTCPRTNFDPPSWPADSDGKMAGMGDPVNKGEGVGFPDVNCDGYASPLRADVHFPSCYNPDAGLTNYKSNMVFPSDDGHGKQDCPKGWVHVPHLFLEVYWNTPLFKDRWEQAKGSQPFVLSNGDATGYSLHADFMAGWDEKLLQHIIDTCDAGTSGMDKCPDLFHGLNEGDDCTIASPVNEKTDGVLDSLPGNNRITGWAYGGGSGGDGYKPPPSRGGDGSTTASEPMSSSMPTNEPRSSRTPNSEPGDESSSTEAPVQSATDTPTTVYSPTNDPTNDPTNAPTNDPTNDPTNAPTNVRIVSPSSAPGSSPPTHSPSSEPSLCIPKTVTVRETVTVTAGMPAATTASASNNSTTGTVGGFKYVGCFKDARDRVLRGEIRANLGAVSNDKCVSHCKEAGYALAGTEHGGECYCGNELVGSEHLDDSKCHMMCEGNPSDVCGGGWALTVYSKDGEASMKSTRGRRHLYFNNHLRRYHSPLR